MTSDQSVEPTVKELFDLTGKVALITGGSGYLGGAMARALAEAGAIVVVSSRELKRSEQVVASLNGTGQGTHHAVQLDHLNQDSIKEGFGKAVELTGGLDILINNGQYTLAKDWTELNPAKFGPDTQMGAWRLDVSAVEPAADSVYLHVLYPTDTKTEKMPECSVEKKGEELAVKVGELSYVFKKQ